MQQLQASNDAGRGDGNVVRTFISKSCRDDGIRMVTATRMRDIRGSVGAIATGATGRSKPCNDHRNKTTNISCRTGITAGRGDRYLTCTCIYEFCCDDGINRCTSRTIFCKRPVGCIGIDTCIAANNARRGDCYIICTCIFVVQGGRHVTVEHVPSNKPKVPVIGPRPRATSSFSSKESSHVQQPHFHLLVRCHHLP